MGGPRRHIRHNVLVPVWTGTMSVRRIDAVTAGKVKMDEPGFRARSGVGVSNGRSRAF